MARAIWTGAISFGLVNIPVGLYSATEDKTIHFNQFEKGTADRIRYQRVNERTGKEVDYDDIVKGHDLGGGDYVIVTDEELEAVEPGRSRTIDITDFVDLDEIDPIYFQKTYYVAPRAEEAGPAYGLLREAMAATNKVGIANFVMRGKQYLVCLRADENVLALETMFFADEVRTPADEIDRLPRKRKISTRDMNTAKQLIESMSATWDPSNYRDTYRERVEDLIDRKRKGEDVVSQEQKPADESRVVDLMDALRASVEAAGGRHKAGNNATPSPAKQRRRGRAGLDRDQLRDLPKAELAKQAAKLRISGRSKMTRDQLATAVEDALGEGGRRRKAS
jgi:DNA end-binding protein Ku